MGYELKNKKCAVIATGSNEELTPCFEEIFKLTFKYLGMQYNGILYCPCADELDPLLHKNKIDFFTNKLINI